MRREKELNLRAESLEAANHKTTTVGSRIEVLEQKLQSCIVEKNGLELETEEAIQDSGDVQSISVHIVYVTLYISSLKKIFSMFQSGKILKGSLLQWHQPYLRRWK